MVFRRGDRRAMSEPPTSAAALMSDPVRLYSMARASKVGQSNPCEASLGADPVE
jgi:hypothetical protein